MFASFLYLEYARKKDKKDKEKSGRWYLSYVVQSYRGFLFFLFLGFYFVVSAFRGYGFIEIITFSAY